MPITDFRSAVERSDLPAMRDLLADDVVFHSPAVFHGFHGKQTVGGLLEQVVDTFQDFRYVDALDGTDSATHALVFEARVGDKALQGIDILTPGADGRIADLTVMIRPFSGLVALMQELGPKLEAAGVHPTKA